MPSSEPVVSPVERSRRWLLDVLGVTTAEGEADNLRRMLILGSAGSFGLQVTAFGLNFLIGFLLARLLGAEGYGAYTYAISWAMLLGIPAGLGLSRLMIREVAGYAEERDWSRLKGLLAWANRAVGVSSLLTLMIAFVVFWLIRHRLATPIEATLWIGFLLVPVLSIVRTNQASLQGLQHVVQGQMSESLVQPLALVALVLGGWALVGQDFSASTALSLHIAAAIIALLSSVWLLRRALPGPVRPSEARSNGSVWLRSALSLVLLGGLHVVNKRTDILMLGALAGAEPVGIYGVATRGADLIALAVAPVHTVLGPTVARLYAAGQRARLERIITRAARAVFLVSLPIAAVLIGFGHRFLLIFGEEFARGRVALATLGVGHLLVALVGPVALILIMTHNERLATRAVGIGAVLNIVLNGLLIPAYGVEGAAVATATSSVLWAGIMLVYVMRTTHIQPTIVTKPRLAISDDD